MQSYQQFANVYDRLMEEMPYPEWVGFAEQIWERYGEPRTVADLGCGTGNIALPLARSGRRIYGIDLSADMLAVARQKQEQLQAGGGSVVWLQQDIREWELGEPVDSVISFCDTFNYLTEEEDVILAFRQTYEGLKEGGCFIFDMHHPNQLRMYAKEQPFVLNEDDLAYIWISDLDEDRCEIEHQLTIFARSEQEGHNRGLYGRIDEVHIQRAYEPEWVLRALHETGFRDVRAYADFSLQPVSNDTTARVFYTALK